MPIIGADLSRYDPNSAASEYPFVVLNVEDPGMATKADIARDAGVPVMLYSWLYGGGGGQTITRTYAAEELLRLNGVIVRHHWIDYEDGVVPADLDAAKAQLRGDYAPVGTYGYLAMIQQQGADFWDSVIGPLWIAYYPEGYSYVPYYDHMSDTARRYGAVMHQFTSVGPPDERDLNAVLNEDWFTATTQGEEPMPSTDEIVAALTGPGPYGVSQVEAAVMAALDKKVSPAIGLDGKPWRLTDWISLMDHVQGAQFQQTVAKAVEDAYTSLPSTPGPNGGPTAEAVAEATLALLGERLTKA